MCVCVCVCVYVCVYVCVCMYECVCVCRFAVSLSLKFHAKKNINIRRHTQYCIQWMMHYMKSNTQSIYWTCMYVCMYVCVYMIGINHIGNTVCIVDIGSGSDYFEYFSCTHWPALVHSAILSVCVGTLSWSCAHMQRGEREICRDREREIHHTFKINASHTLQLQLQLQCILLLTIHTYIHTYVFCLSRNMCCFLNKLELIRFTWLYSPLWLAVISLVRYSYHEKS